MFRSSLSERSLRVGCGLGFRHLLQERIPLQELPAQLQLSHGLLRQAVNLMWSSPPTNAAAGGRR
jgi:hypothetical protein